MSHNVGSLTDKSTVLDQGAGGAMPPSDSMMGALAGIATVAGTIFSGSAQPQPQLACGLSPMHIPFDVHLQPAPITEYELYGPYPHVPKKQCIIL